MSIEASNYVAIMKQALEALEQIDKAMPFPVGKKAITSLRQAIAEAEKLTDFSKVFAQMKADGEPCSEVLALGQMMRDWLQHQISDNGSAVDTGKGFYEYDLWVMCEGKELLITIKEKRPTK